MISVFRLNDAFSATINPHLTLRTDYRIPIPRLDSTSTMAWHSRGVSNLDLIKSMKRKFIARVLFMLSVLSSITQIRCFIHFDEPNFDEPDELLHGAWLSRGISNSDLICQMKGMNSNRRVDCVRRRS